MKRQIANLTSNILNPFLVGPVVISLLSFKSAASTADAIKWSLISIAVSIVPVFSIIVYLVHHRKLEGIFVSPRRQRNKIYLLASVCAVVGFIIILSLGAPPVLVATFVAGLASVLIFMCVNFLWKISVHTAFIAASITILIVSYGYIGAVAAVLLPPIVWARVEMEQHSIAQAAAGALLVALVVLVVFYLFGLITS